MGCSSSAFVESFSFLFALKAILTSSWMLQMLLDSPWKRFIVESDNIDILKAIYSFCIVPDGESSSVPQK